jgi:hypothetical protein
MATNKLMEAAAEILAGSKKSASSMPNEKMPGAEVEDLGGPTPQNSKPDDDSNKIHASKSAKTAMAPTTKPSAASADTQDTLKKMSEEEETEEEIIAEKMHDDEKKEMMKKKMKEDMDALFSDDSTISEEFKSKAATIFEARVLDRVTQIEEEVESKYAGMLEEAVAEIKSDLTTKVDDYLNYVVEQWIEENQIAIESGLRAELTEEFIAGLRNLFAEHYIDVPTEKVDLVDELAGKVEELESKLNEEMERGISYAKALVESRKNEITREVCEGLTTTQTEKIKTLAESVEFSTEDEYKNKVETIRENYFPSGIKKADANDLHEQVEDTAEQKVITDPFVAAVSQAISKTKL